MVTWRALAAEVTADLACAQVEYPEVDARRIIEAATGVDGSDYHEVLGQEATTRAVVALDGMVARRRAGEPLQYVIGSWGFRTLDLFIDRRVLIPRPETEVVAGIALDEIDRLGAGTRTVVDLGTGSGAIALAIAVERPQTTVWATDRSEDALDVARANLAGTGRAATRVSLAQGNWFEALPDALMGSIDVIVSNPPYVRADEHLPSVVADWEPADALVAGPDGLEAVREVLTGSVAWLAPGGSVVVEMAPDQTMVAAGVAHDLGLADIVVRPDLAGRDRALVARRPR